PPVSSVIAPTPLKSTSAAVLNTFSAVRLSVSALALLPGTGAATLLPPAGVAHRPERRAVGRRDGRPRILPGRPRRPPHRPEIATAGLELRRVPGRRDVGRLAHTGFEELLVRRHLGLEGPDLVPERHLGPHDAVIVDRRVAAPADQVQVR